MLDLNGPKILEITGKLGAGKSYFARYLLHLEAALGNRINVAYLNLDEEDILTVEPFMLARRVLQELEIDNTALPAQPPEEAEPRWYKAIVQVLANCLEGSRPPTQVQNWIVLDGFKTSLPASDPTHDFIQLLAEYMAQNLRQTRLILLDGYELRGTAIAEVTVREQLEYLTLEDIREFFEKLSHSLQLQGFNLPQKKINQVLTELAQIVPDQGPDSLQWMEGVGRSLNALIEDVLAQL
jgi:hypothetical protein